MVRYYVELPVMQEIAETIRWAEQQRDVIKVDPSVTPRQMPQRIRELPIGTSMDFATDDEFRNYVYGEPQVDIVYLMNNDDFYSYIYTPEELEILKGAQL